MHRHTHRPHPPPQRIRLIRFENVFTGSLAEPQGLQGLFQEDEGAKDPLSSSATERCARYSVTSVPHNGPNSRRRALWKISVRQAWHAENKQTFYYLKYLLVDANKMFHLFSDITFIHEGNKTFHDNLVNFEKLVSPWTLYRKHNSCAEFEMPCLKKCPSLFPAHDSRHSAAHPAVSERSHGSVLRSLVSHFMVVR